MPELPEVETIRRELSRKIKGKKIMGAEVHLPKVLNVSAGKFAEELEGAKIGAIERRAKLLTIRLAGKYNLLVHLKMTGQLVYAPARDKQRPDKYTPVVFRFDDGSRLFYNDMRQFGYIKLLGDRCVERELERHEFGPEPLGKGFTLEVFKELLGKNKRKKIKPLLMDPKFVVGIGNIYASEVCFAAKVHPERIAGDLEKREIKAIYSAIGKILKKAIEFKGTSSDNYVTTSGKKGKYEEMLKVYGREGEKCLRCGGEVKRIKLGGRGTFFCPECQE